MKATGEVAVAAAVVVVVVELVVPIEYNKNSGVYTMKLSWVFFFFQVHVLVFFHGYRTQDNESPHVWRKRGQYSTKFTC